jgi:ribosome biogenesis GTPase A
MSVTRCLEQLDEAIDAARSLGFPVDEAVAVASRARERLGLAGDAYVVALVGGTGVGKSSLLNALAGEEVAAVSARRPTTDRAVAWVPREHRAALAPVLRWLGVDRVREHERDGLGAVAVLDLPDLDSVAREHRAKVDELLPRIDAIAWVVDPEKYKDLVLHDAYLRRWARRVPREVVVLNRVDLLPDGAERRVRDDLRDELSRASIDAPIVATESRAGAADVEELRRWLAAESDAKRVVAARLGTEARETIGDLARRAAVDGPEITPLVDAARREAALRDVARAAVAIVDVRGLERQAVAATRLSARRRGTGPLGIVTSALYRWSGRARASADPATYLRRWRERGSLAPASEPVRALVVGALPPLPSTLRPAVAALAQPANVERRVAEAIDRAVEIEAREIRVPASVLWSAVGAAQYVVAALLIFAAIWFASLFVLDRPAVGTIDVPLLGPIPAPVMLLAAVLLAGYVLTLLLRLHAGWVARRWAGRVAARIRSDVEARIGESLFVPLDAIEAARARLAAALRDCYA